MRTATLALALVACTGVGAQQGSSVPGSSVPANAAIYDVRFSFTGHTGSLASAPGCPVRPDGKAVMSGTLWGLEQVPNGDDILYHGVLRLDVDIDLCEARGNGDQHELCRLTVVGGGPMNVELAVYFDDRGGYVKATRGKGVFGANATGDCGAAANNEELQAFPDNSMANPFNGTDINITSGPLRVGRYENVEAVFEVLRVVRR